MVGVSTLRHGIQGKGRMRKTLQRKNRKFSAYVFCAVCKTLTHSEAVCVCGEVMCVHCYFWRHEPCEAAKLAMGLATGATAKPNYCGTKSESITDRLGRRSSAPPLRNAVFDFEASEISGWMARKDNGLEEKKSRSRDDNPPLRNKRSRKGHITGGIRQRH